ncbi:MAG: hypothetical protein COV74_08640 [Candidatus Omnitrophica bacterium CG11_big_fil_rev_8_21_14_0_20_45_26]|uniref:Uncharacterized protein n=1 Tax=Candidatus Abzuiibacterium crystallinum TaxID=1974748 RepID=A0A2H0LMG4_9BACT|nr:MAG: hypothetical protein COV74_08640 [Candidatus Omnitrophica bacterium CG11_big_fil_rev_8_21_14_0_20_45_26]PIW63728.1 MAG: hypothetical protein COW12_09525 [Candidatus Omnitrophica bacterium CG12_big_fil_rev_8_21_14_0_65_45_16]
MSFLKTKSNPILLKTIAIVLVAAFSWTETIAYSDVPTTVTQTIREEFSHARQQTLINNGWLQQTGSMEALSRLQTAPELRAELREGETLKNQVNQMLVGLTQEERSILRGLVHNKLTPQDSEVQTAGKAWKKAGIINSEGRIPRTVLDILKELLPLETAPPQNLPPRKRYPFKLALIPGSFNPHPQLYTLLDVDRDDNQAALAWLISAAEAFITTSRDSKLADLKGRQQPVDSKAGVSILLKHINGNRLRFAATDGRLMMGDFEVTFERSELRDWIKTISVFGLFDQDVNKAAKSAEQKLLSRQELRFIEKDKEIIADQIQLPFSAFITIPHEWVGVNFGDEFTLPFGIVQSKKTAVTLFNYPKNRRPGSDLQLIYVNVEGKEIPAALGEQVYVNVGKSARIENKTTGLVVSIEYVSKNDTGRRFEIKSNKKIRLTFKRARHIDFMLADSLKSGDEIHFFYRLHGENKGRPVKGHFVSYEIGDTVNHLVVQENDKLVPTVFPLEDFEGTGEIRALGIVLAKIVSASTHSELRQKPAEDEIETKSDEKEQTELKFSTTIALPYRWMTINFNQDFLLPIGVVQNRANKNVFQFPKPYRGVRPRNLEVIYINHGKNETLVDPGRQTYFNPGSAMHYRNKVTGLEVLITFVSQDGEVRRFEIRSNQKIRLNIEQTLNAEFLLANSLKPGDSIRLLYRAHGQTTNRVIYGTFVSFQDEELTSLVVKENGSKEPTVLLLGDFAGAGRIVGISIKLAESKESSSGHAELRIQSQISLMQLIETSRNRILPKLATLRTMASKENLAESILDEFNIVQVLILRTNLSLDRQIEDARMGAFINSITDDADEEIILDLEHDVHTGERYLAGIPIVVKMWLALMEERVQAEVDQDEVRIKKAKEELNRLYVSIGIQTDLQYKLRMKRNKRSGHSELRGKFVINLREIDYTDKKEVSKQVWRFFEAMKAMPGNTQEEIKLRAYSASVALLVAAGNGNRIYSQIKDFMKQDIERLTEESFQSWRRWLIGRMALAEFQARGRAPLRENLFGPWLYQIEDVMARADMPKTEFEIWAFGYLLILYAMSEDGSIDYNEWKEFGIIRTKELPNQTPGDITNRLWAWVLQLAAAASVGDKITFQIIQSEIMKDAGKRTLVDALTTIPADDWRAWAFAIGEWAAALIERRVPARFVQAVSKAITNAPNEGDRLIATVTHQLARAASNVDERAELRIALPESANDRTQFARAVEQAHALFDQNPSAKSYFYDRLGISATLDQSQATVFDWSVAFGDGLFALATEAAHSGTLIGVVYTTGSELELIQNANAMLPEDRKIVFAKTPQALAVKLRASGAKRLTLLTRTTLANSRLSEFYDRIITLSDNTIKNLRSGIAGLADILDREIRSWSRIAEMA